MQIVSQGDKYALVLNPSELRTIILSLLILPDRYSEEAIQDLLGSDKREISDLQTRISDGKYAVDREKMRQHLDEEGLLGESLSEPAEPPKISLQELIHELIEAARARAAAIEQKDLRGDVLAEFSIFGLLNRLGSRSGGHEILLDLATHDDPAVRYAIADQWHGIESRVAIQILEQIAHDVDRPLLAYVAGVKYRERASAARDSTGAAE